MGLEIADFFRKSFEKKPIERIGVKKKENEVERIEIEIEKKDNGEDKKLEFLRELGVSSRDIDKIKSGDNPEIGKPKQGEHFAPTFFPHLAVGLPIGDKVYRIEPNNLENPFDIDLRIIEEKSGKRIGWIDVERRTTKGNTEKPFREHNKGRDISIHIPIKSLAGKLRGDSYLKDKTKIKYFKEFPDRTFHLTINAGLTQAVICLGRDIINSPVITLPPINTSILEDMFDVPSEHLVWAKVGEFYIEEFVLRKLREGGYL